VAKDREVNISLFTIKRSALRIPMGSWLKIQGILRESLSSDPSSTSADDTAAAAIKILKDRIQIPPKKYSAKSRQLLANFKKIIQGIPIFFPGGMHCETLLATLSKYFESSLQLRNDNTNLISTCKVFLFTYCLLNLTVYCKVLLQSGMMSVSKLCCPVCWELLEILNEEKPLSLRGRHSTIYPVELPKWLPPGIVDKMNKQFQKHLQREIKIMLERTEPPIRQTRHVAHESESNISEASANCSIKLESYN
jgi:hypothetical protein